MLGKSEKLRKVANYFFEQGKIAGHFEYETMQVEAITIFLGDQMTLMKGYMSSLSTLVEMLKVECTNAYRKKGQLYDKQLEDPG